MDTYPGATTKPITLNKYLYANGDSINMTDPGGEFSITEETETALVGNIQSSIGTASLTTLSKPLMAKAILYTAAALTGTYVILDRTTKTIIEDCMKSSFSGANDCKPDFPMYIVGDDYYEIRDHIGDAINDGKPSMLSRKTPGYSRGWLESRKGLGKPCTNAPGTQCDEYPFASSIEGGAANDVSLRSVDAPQNSGAGSQLRWFYTKCNIPANNPSRKYKVLTMKGIPKTGYICGR